MNNIEEEFGISLRIRQEFPMIELRTILLNFETRGAAETLYIVLQHMNEEELKRKTISLDCDTIYFTNVLESFRNLNSEYNSIFYFNDEGEKPVFSYITLDKEDFVTEVREKVAISKNANTGAYGFSSGEVMRNYCTKILNGGVGETGEYYVSNIIASMLEDKAKFKGIYVDDFSCVGTPWQLEEFMKRIKLRPELIKKQRFCFDLDNTLVTHPEVRGDYSTVKPIWKNIKLVRELKEMGHYIIIWTARRMKTHNGNVGKVVKDVALVTLSKLEEFGVPYDEIFFGKPYAQVYVDDLAVNALLDTEKEVGWGQTDESTPKRKEMITPRHFNTIQTIGDVVIKTTHDFSGKGEAYFYQNIPSSLSEFFPKLLKIEEITFPIQSTSLSMEKIHGTVFTHLLTNRCVTEGRLLKLLNCLNQIHNHQKELNQEPKYGQNGTLQEIDIYANYAPKLELRFEKFQQVYKTLGSDIESHYKSLIEGLLEYQKKDRAKKVDIIHGDPVFSNLFLTSDSKIKMIDMRGHLGEKLSISGDALYDYAKVLQSLFGYDFVLMNKTLESLDLEILQKLRSTLFTFLSNLYPDFNKQDILIITSSLFFSLIPLHADPNHQVLFFNLSKNILKEIS